MISTLSSLTRTGAPIIINRRTTTRIVVTGVFSSAVLLLLNKISVTTTFAGCKVTGIVTYRIVQITKGDGKLLVFTVVILAINLSTLVSGITTPILYCSLLAPLFHNLPANDSLAGRLVLTISITTGVNNTVDPVDDPRGTVKVDIIKSIK